MQTRPRTQLTPRPPHAILRQRVERRMRAEDSVDYQLDTLRRLSIAVHQASEDVAAHPLDPSRLSTWVERVNWMLTDVDEAAQ